MKRIFSAVSLLLYCALAPAALAQETPKDIIAAHVRLQGYKCAAPKSATPDAKASRPDEAVWILVCEDARYKVRLIPHLADVIQPF
jgi:hypothetical protein